MTLLTSPDSKVTETDMYLGISIESQLDSILCKQIAADIFSSKKGFHLVICSLIRIIIHFTARAL
ncbi:MAG: hypothetical protein COW76_17850 [Shewanella sp. CG18_big_fil_WC_8_21_14_2_50_42_11]|nr:MAG: hypothetical protein COW76_17850 [Shewanella sp. CG18_big_fil_WC_8_21_14_2_50_42_11]PIX70081.1 MAG: hypothetical protein COZ42_16325 [Shewanella sp. CG_4_10_14_3_um_filter_42_91]PIY65696.1 MAG: hypothetical protein COY92_12385 [Shewanella sp. CG_4_10_14_0_8_um_filter_42_13]PJB91962.1 MAG: hypothetical protein CO084_09105 [Shewanella sp. CG_4_9_14_0_8_um_filter_42_14]